MVLYTCSMTPSWPYSLCFRVSVISFSSSSLNSSQLCSIRVSLLPWIRVDSSLDAAISSYVQFSSVMPSSLSPTLILCNNLLHSFCLLCVFVLIIQSPSVCKMIINISLYRCILLAFLVVVVIALCSPMVSPPVPTIYHTGIHTRKYYALLDTFLPPFCLSDVSPCPSTFLSSSLLLVSFFLCCQYLSRSFQPRPIVSIFSLSISS